MFKKSVSICVILIILSSLSGCMASNINNDKINLKSINITSDDYSAQLTLSFVNGSRKSGYNEYPASKLPKYKIEFLDSPQRLVLTFYGLSFWDFSYDAGWQFSGFLQGVFKEVPAGKNELKLYVQLSRSVEYETTESNDSLILYLNKSGENQGVKYYCISDSFLEYQSGKWPSTINMTPELCSDHETRVLISKAFDTAEQANAFMADANEKIKGILPDNSVYVTQLEPGILPEYNDNESAPVINILSGLDDKLLIQDGRYLASSPDGSILFSKRSSDSDDIADNYTSEALWIKSTEGISRRLNLPEFYSIQNAAFSFDGKYIAVLDVSDYGEVLYVYEISSGELINLGEEGFGSATDSFSWSDRSEKIYAVTGDDSTQIMSADFSDGKISNITTIRKLTCPEGSLAVSQGRLFYSENSTESGEIYEYGMPDRDITSGTEFNISADGKSMLVLEPVITDGEDILTSLKLCDIQTGKSAYIVKNADVSGYCFSSDCSKVYFTVEEYGDDFSDYEYKLYSYDIGDNSLSEGISCMAECIAAGGSEGEIYIIYNEPGVNYETFIYNMDH